MSWRGHFRIEPGPRTTAEACLMIGGGDRLSCFIAHLYKTSRLCYNCTRMARRPYYLW